MSQMSHDDEERTPEQEDEAQDRYWNAEAERQRPWGEQQEQVDWLESRYDDAYGGGDW
jgi:hypothetical protein